MKINTPIIKLSFYLLLLSSCFVGCSKSGSSSDSGVDGSTTGLGGSTARFTIAGNFMYTVDDQQMHIFDISNPAVPTEVQKIKVGTRIETIFNKGKNLFIGSQSGMYIYDLSTPENPYLLSIYTHIVSCDPVVADSNYAYVTLRSESRRCGSTTNRLDIVDISNLMNLRFKTSLLMSSPKGLGVDGKTLFVCDNGLKILDISNIDNIKVKHNFLLSATDVIPYNGHLLVTGNKALTQYAYTNDTISLISQIKF